MSQAAGLGDHCRSLPIKIILFYSILFHSVPFHSILNSASQIHVRITPPLASCRQVTDNAKVHPQNPGISRRVLRSELTDNLLSASPWHQHKVHAKTTCSLSHTSQTSTRHLLQGNIISLKSVINTPQLAAQVQISPSEERAGSSSSIPLTSFSSFRKPRIDIIPPAHHHPPHICQSDASYVLSQITALETTVANRGHF